MKKNPFIGQPTPGGHFREVGLKLFQDSRCWLIIHAYQNCSLLDTKSRELAQLKSAPNE